MPEGSINVQNEDSKYFSVLRNMKNDHASQLDISGGRWYESGLQKAIEEL